MNPRTHETTHHAHLSIRHIVIVPHTHWDREWYEPEPVFRLALVATVDRVLDLLECGQLPVFLLDGQMAIVEDYLTVRPEQTEHVRALARQGRLLMGPWYVLADELLTGDEALVRNLLIGRAAAERLGRWLPVGYSPDAFGHPAALPTILRGFGIETAIIWRGYGGEPGQDGDLFDWQAPDGARVLTHHLPPDGYESGAGLPTEKTALAKRWEELRSVLESRADTGVVLLLNGADHHGPQPDIHDVAAPLEDITGAKVTVSSPETYFTSVTDVRVPTVRGELRFSYRYTWTLQGVHATRSRVKRIIAECEQLLTRWAEPQSALLGSGSEAVLERLWREHLSNCAHDSIGGCCSDQVARDVERRATGVGLAARRLWVEAVLRRAGHDPVAARRSQQAWKPALLVVNPTPRARAGVVETTLTFKIADIAVGRPSTAMPPAAPAHGSPPIPSVWTPEGEPLPLQILASAIGYERIDSPEDYPDQDLVHQIRVAVRVPAVPPVGVRGFSVREVETAANRGVGAEAVRAHGNGVRSLQWDITGAGRAFRIDARTDSRAWLDVADVESQGDAGDTYTFESDGSSCPADWGPSAVLHAGPLVAVIARPFEIGGRVRGTVYMRLAANTDLVWVTVEGENLAGAHRLRVRFPAARSDTASHALPAVADMHYGWAARYRSDYDMDEYPSEWPVATAPMHRFVSVGGVMGITVLSRGAFEYEHDAGGGVGVTILRAVDQLSRSGLRSRPGHAGWPMATPDARELGPFRLELGWWGRGVTPAGSGEEWDPLLRIGETFHAPLAGVPLRSALRVPPAVEGPQLVGNGLAVRAIKSGRLPGTVVLRCVNMTRAVVRGAWVWPGSIRRAIRTRLDETPVDGAPLSVAKHKIPFSAKPHEVVTILVTVRDS